MSRWQDLVRYTDLEPGDVTLIIAGRRRFAVYDTEDGVYISSAQCTHGGADLCDGYLDGFVIECPLHQGCFDIRNGNPIDAPVTRQLTVFPARVFGEMVQIQLPD